MTSNTAHHNQKPIQQQELRRVVFRSGLFTFIVIVANSFFFSINMSTLHMIEPIDAIFRVSSGPLLGFLVIWLVFPQSFYPGTFKESFPKIHLVCLILPLPFVLITLGILPAGLLPTQLIREIVPITSFALITYVFFFSVLRIGIKSQGTNSSAPVTS